MATKKAQPQKPKSKGYEVAEVRVGYGMTLNLGNYESFRADAGCVIRATTKCKTEDEAAILRDSMYKEGWEIVKEELSAQVRAVREKTRKKEGDE